LFPDSRTKILLLAFVVSFLGASILLWMFRPFGTVTTVHFQVRRGLSAREIAHDLQQGGLLNHPWTFLIWVKLMGAKAIRPGVYDLSSHASGLGIYRTLIKGPLRARVTFPEGWTAKQMAALLETHGVTSAAEFMAFVDKNKSEGYLFPDTYIFEQGLPGDRVAMRLLERFKEKEPKDFLERAKAMKLSERQLVTLASIVEREARVPQERPLISGVFYNRLKKHWYLESCATVEYALGAWKPHLTYKDLNVVSPYNTYRHGGLPPGPICNPGEAALEAAAHPAQTDMMFFVADGQGTHRFSRYYNEHLAVQKKRAASSELRADQSGASK
jgi:UPF0755 protein